MAPISTFIKWEVIYVGSATSHDYDQIIANVNVGPIEVGMNRFVLKANPPKLEDIPVDDFKFTVIMLKAFYNDNEFIRIGYYVNNVLPDEIDNPSQCPLNQIQRQILLEDTTVHQNQIPW